ncbi:polyamine ABC transporter ATP-binding protein [Deinococcus koreensis]|uniref:Polyamine ABC transporter ATP-binding protein n=2 Tax=Deinococcus koreensis TaxID=2054903 RepID=A0A2K3V2J3_9DEIO|nr:polyamine ABC transporter ATP-binding protein [Deinococcus koreensis]
MVVRGVQLSVRPGEFYSLLGPSGSGKTTCLRLIAGFETPGSGTVHLFGQDATHQPAYDRPVNTVFQDYALFPHMTVGQNVAYPLTVRGRPKAEQERRAGELLELVHLPGFAGRRVSQLSGGQRQRVALARALAHAPKLLLLDEPLGALDLKLREAMQSELRALHRTLGLTCIYVTHDQGEALSLSDRVAVFRDGRVVQEDTPQNLYDHPRTAFVADFVGGANVLPAGVLGTAGGAAQYALRPERLRLTSPDAPGPHLTGRVIGAGYQGAYTKLEAELDGGQSVVAHLPGGPADLRPGDPVTLAYDPTDLRALEPEA